MSDVSNKVVGIQGNPVSSSSPEDEDVLSWSSSDGYWRPQSLPFAFGNVNQETFTSNGTWTAPSNVSMVFVVALGGGSGGCGSQINNVGGPGGNGALLQSAFLPVTPGTNYSVVIGAGGTGGTAGALNVSSPGGSTTFGNIFSAAGGAAVFYSEPVQPFIGGGGIGGQSSPLSGFNGNTNTSIGGIFSGGVGGSGATNAAGGGGGGAGPRGNGADGGSAGSGVANVGSNGGNNTGAGGGGAGATTVSQANGGNGGSGWLAVYW